MDGLDHLPLRVQEYVSDLDQKIAEYERRLERVFKESEAREEALGRPPE